MFTLFCLSAPLRLLIWEGYGPTVVPAAPGVFSFGASRFLEGQVGYFSNRGWVRSGYVHNAGKCCFTLTVGTTLEWGGFCRSIPINPLTFPRFIDYSNLGLFHAFRSKEGFPGVFHSAHCPSLLSIITAMEGPSVRGGAHWCSHGDHRGTIHRSSSLDNLQSVWLPVLGPKPPGYGNKLLFLGVGHDVKQ